MGLLLGVLVTSADVDDAAAAPELLEQLGDQRSTASIERVYGDSKYHNHALYGWVRDNGDYDLDIVRRPKDAQGWVLLPIRWTVERTFAWLFKYRRLSVDREKTTTSAEAMIRLAMIHLMIHRLKPEDNETEFKYTTGG